MSQRNRFGDIAIGLTVGIGLTLLYAVWAVPGFRSPADAQIGQPHTQAADGTNNGQSSAEGDWWPKFTPSDTYAQWIAALVAVAATGISIWAVKLVRDTLEETRRTANAAESQIAVARQIGEAQVRAYLSCVGGDFCFERLWAQFSITLENKGQSPAFNVHAEAYAEISMPIGLADPQGTHRTQKVIGSTQIIPAGGKSPIYFLWSSTEIQEKAFAQVLGGGCRIGLNARVAWTDVFGKEQTIIAFTNQTEGVSALNPLSDEPAILKGALYAYNQSDRG